MGKVLNRVRQYLYPLDAARPQEWRKALIVLGVLAVLSLFVRIQGLDFRVWGLLPVSAYAVWVAINLYLLLGVVWGLLDPREEKTAEINRARRALLACLALLTVVVSLVAVWLW